jgi:UDP-2,3-diacylglucosamine pyrophosphatase LpxH
MLAWVMLRAVLADLHLGRAESDLAGFQATVRMITERGAQEVVFLGDLFVALVGFEKFWDTTIRTALTELAELRRRGVRVVMIEGNRDFFLDEAALHPYRDVAAPVHSFVAGGRRFLIEHGDLINGRDRAYLFWRSVSKSKAARVWARFLPAPLARRIVFRTEARLAQTNFSYRIDLPAEELEAAARRHFASGVDVVLWGHFHRSWSFHEAGHAAHVVEGWLDQGQMLWIEPDGRLVAEIHGRAARE